MAINLVGFTVFQSARWKDHLPQFLNEAGTAPLNLSTWTIEMYVLPSPGAARIALLSTAGTTIVATNAANGEAQMNVPQATIAGWLPGELFQFVRAVNGSDSVNYWSGPLVVLPRNIAT